MKKLYDLKDKLFDVLERLADEPSLNPSNIEFIHLITDTIKNIDKICMLEEGGGYSQDDGMDYGRGSSNANRGQHWVRGHYSRDSGGDGGSGYSSRRGGGRGGNSRNGGYSRDGGRSEMMEHLEMALDTADEQDRETIRRFMQQMERA